MTRTRLPATVKPMLATLGPLPDGPGWAFEFKWDGVRAVVSAADDAVRAVSRNDLDITASYPELLDLPRQLGGTAVVLDGELVAIDKDGTASFGLLQQRMHVKTPSAALLARIPVQFFAFDLLWTDGHATLSWPYDRRREALDALALHGPAPMSVPPSAPPPGQVLLDSAAEHGIEGVVAKRVDSTYQPGRRSPAWIKVPLNRTQEVIVVGWTPGEGRRTGRIGALLLAAYNQSGELDFIGQVGTGFTGKMLDDIAARLAPLHRDTSPITGEPVPRQHARNAQWTDPSLVGEVQFRAWTPDGRLRHPSWRGLRMDKGPADVTVTR
jgi:bifunctional non-homologous end joining protein LigD